MTIGSCIVGIQLCCCNIQVYGKKLSKALRHSAKKPRFSVHWSKIPHLIPEVLFLAMDVH